MHDSDKFKWMSLDDALAVAAFVALLFGAPFILALVKPEPIDHDAAWHRRHEANSRACRGQQYVSQCCENARTDLTCISAELKGSQ